MPWSPPSNKSRSEVPLPVCFDEPNIVKEEAGLASLFTFPISFELKCWNESKDGADGLSFANEPAFGICDDVGTWLVRLDSQNRYLFAF